MHADNMRRELVSSIGAFGGFSTCSPQLGSSNGCESGILGAFPSGFCNMTNLNQFATYPAAPPGVTYVDHNSDSTLYGSKGNAEYSLGIMDVSDVTMSEYTNNQGFMATLMAWTLNGGSAPVPPINLFAQLGRDPSTLLVYVGINLYDPNSGVYNMNIVNSMLPVDSNGNHYLTVPHHNGCNQHIVWPDLAAIGYAKMRNLPINDFGGARPDDAMSTISGLTQLWVLNGRGAWSGGVQAFANTLGLSIKMPGGVLSKPNMAVMTTFNLADLPNILGFYDGQHEIMAFADSSSLRVYMSQFIYRAPYGDELVVRPDWAYAVQFAGQETISGIAYDMYNIYNPMGYNRAPDFTSPNILNPIKVIVNFLFYVSDVIVTTRNIYG